MALYPEHTPRSTNQAPPFCLHISPLKEGIELPIQSVCFDFCMPAL